MSWRHSLLRKMMQPTTHRAPRTARGAQGVHLRPGLALETPRPGCYTLYYNHYSSFSPLRRQLIHDAISFLLLLRDSELNPSVSHLFFYNVLLQAKQFEMRLSSCRMW